MRSDAPVLFLWVPQCHGNAFPDASDKKNGPLSRSAAFLPRQDAASKQKLITLSGNEILMCSVFINSSSPLRSSHLAFFAHDSWWENYNFHEFSPKLEKLVAFWRKPDDENIPIANDEITRMERRSKKSGAIESTFWQFLFPFPTPRYRDLRESSWRAKRERERVRKREEHYMKSDIPILNFHRIRGKSV